MWDFESYHYRQEMDFQPIRIGSWVSYGCVVSLIDMCNFKTTKCKNSHLIQTAFMWLQFLGIEFPRILIPTRIHRSSFQMDPKC